MVSNEISLRSQRKLHHYLTQIGLIDERNVHIDYTNYTDGDETITIIDDSGKKRDINIDYKKQTRKNRKFLPIELIQVGFTGKYDSWLYNDNINLVVYEWEGNTYLFTHKELKAIAATYYNNEELWNTCLVYKGKEAEYEAERKWIDAKLANVKFVYDIGLTPDPDNFHINGCFNWVDGERRHSGFCINIPLNSKIANEHLIENYRTRRLIER